MGLRRVEVVAVAVLFSSWTSLGQSFAAFGHCVGCESEHSLPTTSEARSAAMDLASRLYETGRVDFPSDDRFVDPFTMRADPFTSSKKQKLNDANKNNENDGPIPTTRLTDIRGKMLGVLVCEYGEESTPLVLRAFAGAIDGRWKVDGWVPPVGGAAPEDIPQWPQVMDGVTDMTKRMDAVSAEAGEGGEEERRQEWSRLRTRRKALSTEALRLIRANQEVCNFCVTDGDKTATTTTMTRTLEDVYLESMNDRRARRTAMLAESCNGNCNDGTNKKRSKKQKKRHLQRMPALIGAPSQRVVSKGMPVGAGDCCATKLLAFAADYNSRVRETALRQRQQQQRWRHRRPGNDSDTDTDPDTDPNLKLLRPVGIAEIFFGTSKQTQQPREGKSFPKASSVVASPSDASAVAAREKQLKSLVGNDGVFYDACELRCQPVLGFLLCGLNNST